MAHGDAREGKWKGNCRMEWVASTLHTTSEHGVSSITTADAHNSAASSRLNWRPRRFKWTRPFRQKTKPGFCACAITFQLASTTCPNTFRLSSCITTLLQTNRLSLTEDSSLLRSDTVLLGEWFPMFQKNTVLASSRERSSWIARHWRWRHCNPTKCQESLTQWRSITSKKVLPVSNTAVITLYLVFSEERL
jgi:hypothetical protein